jgi:RNA polymerase-binding transcription factor DksA
LEKDTGRHEKEVDDFCKQYRGEKLYEVDRMIKETEDLLNKLEKLHGQVKGDVDGFTGYLNENNNDPEERERVKLIEDMLKKCGEFDGECKKTGKDIGLIRGVLDGIK